MTVALPANEITGRVDSKLLSGIRVDEDKIFVDAGLLVDFIKVLKETPGLEFDYLVDITVVDYWDYFELIYQFLSIKNNHKLTIRTRLSGRENLNCPSITGLFKGADCQEREIFDLFGIKFTSHPKLKRIVLWEGFQGYPLRKDYIQ